MGRIHKNIPNIDDHLDFSYNRPGQDVRYSISCDPLKQLGWESKLVFDECLPELINYYKQKRWAW